jgi:hypothetical protein
MSHVSAVPGHTIPDGLGIVPESLATADDATFGIAQDQQEAKLIVFAPAGSGVLTRFEGTTQDLPNGSLLTAPRTAHNAAALRQVFPWLQPRPLGLRTSAGFGDRLGLATAGHIRAMRSVGGDLAPIFAQQSIREMERTNRSAQEIVDDAMWDVFAHGWRDGYGADADHLKTNRDIDLCVAAGYTFYTFDPSDHVGQVAPGMSATELATQYRGLPWQDLESSPEEVLLRFAGTEFVIESHRIGFDEQTVMRAAVKYSRAIAHVRTMSAHLTASLPADACEIEISVDETDDPTTPAEHIFIASELRRLGVKWISLAPRFIGRFEKGVEYIGSVDAFERDFAVHAAIARHFGPNKLSLHSGSDKFSIYAGSARLTDGCVHLKTAGTSFLEALRVVARHDPALFRRLYRLARDRFEIDRASYQISARLDLAPQPDQVTDPDLPKLLDQFDTRQILHVTFGSLLTGVDAETGSILGDEIKTVLREHPDSYADTLERHFARHLQPFAFYR